MALEQLLRLQLDDVMDEHQRVGAGRLAVAAAAAAAAVAVHVAVAMGTVAVRLAVAAFAPGRREGKLERNDAVECIRIDLRADTQKNRTKHSPERSKRPRPRRAEPTRCTDADWPLRDGSKWGMCVLIVPVGPQSIRLCSDPILTVSFYADNWEPALGWLPVAVRCW